MKNQLWHRLGLTVALAGAALGTSATARADLSSCGDIHVEAQAQCEVVPPSAECEAKCTPISVRAACAGRLAADCRAHCDELPSVQCQGSCQASCSAKCDALDPGSFDCRGSCQVDCSGRCAGECQAKGDQASCEASCKGSCAASCDASCEATPPQVDCDAGCEASCQGSCEVDPNLDCQADCQAEGEVKCEADVQGGCVAQCKTEEGALFCDGEYVDHGDNLQDCLDALRAALNVKVTGEAQGTSQCDGNGCTAQGSAHVKADGGNLCAVTRPGSSSGGLSWSFAAVAGLVVVARRRRSR